MFSKSDFFHIAELRQGIYPELSLVDYGRLLSVSKVIKACLMSYLELRFKHSNSIVFENLPKSCDPENIKSNLPFQQFFVDLYGQYQKKTLKLMDETNLLNNLKNDEIVVKLSTTQTADCNANLAFETYYHLVLLANDGKECSELDKMRLKCQFMFTFDAKHMEDTLEKAINKLTTVSDTEKEKALKHYKIQTTSLELWSTNADSSFLKAHIKNTSDYQWTHPLTLEQVKPHEKEIKRKLSQRCLLEFMTGERAAYENHYSMRTYELYKKQFYNPEFQYCYSRGKINHAQVFHPSYSQDVISLLKQTWLTFECLTSGSIAFFWKSSGRDIVDALIKNPEAIHFLNANSDKKELIFNVLATPDHLKLIEKGLATIEECLVFGATLFNAQTYLYGRSYCFETLATRHEMELFCQGLGSVIQFNMGLAYKELQAYKNELALEKSRIECGREGIFARLTNRFFKEIYGDERQAQCEAITALLHALRKKQGCTVSFEQVEVLTKTLGTNEENTLAKIIRTTLLEPLKIKSLTELDIAFECNQSLTI